MIIQLQYYKKQGSFKMEIIKQNCLAINELCRERNTKQINTHIETILKRVKELKNVY